MGTFDINKFLFSANDLNSGESAGKCKLGLNKKNV